MDGTNLSDDISDRPGIRALQELEARSPLRECGLIKSEIRRLSREAGLFTWDKPAYACLATRIPVGQMITEQQLSRTEWAESFLYSLGFRNFRIRTLGNDAKVQLTSEDFAKIVVNRLKILNTLQEKYSSVLLDLEERNNE